MMTQEGIKRSVCVRGREKEREREREKERENEIQTDRRTENERADRQN